MTTATITVECWGCRKSETYPLVHGEEFEKQCQEMALQGWMRRSFGTPSWDKGPWFCGEDCAYHSFNAKLAESIWAKKTEEEIQREFERYCQETRIPQIYFIALGIIFAIATIFLLQGS